MAYKIKSDCISCGACEAECPVGAISAGADKYEIDPGKCIDCGVSYIVLCVTCLLIYLEMVQIVSMTSPILMVSWLVPLIDYLAYESLLVFNKHEMILNGENISYKSIRAVKLMDKQKKYKIVIRVKGKEYLYKTNEKNSQKIFDYLNKVCPRIDHREKL